MTTLAQLRALLERTPDGPARQRAGGTVEGMARHYFARVLWVFWPGQSLAEQVPADVGVDLLRDPAWCGGPVRLDMGEDGTRRALLTGLALGLGLDPGVGALAVQWTRDTRAGRLRWTVWGAGPSEDSARFWVDFSPIGSGDNEERIVAPTVANEPDPVRALALAVAHVLAQL